MPFLNPNAWAAPAPGTYSTSKPFYNDYRQARQPSEELGFGKVFPIKEGASFSLRADFFNVFNRWVYPGFNNTSNPAATGSGNQLFGVIGREHHRRRRKLRSEKWRVCRKNPVLNVNSPEFQPTGQMNSSGLLTFKKVFFANGRTVQSVPNEVGNYAT